ncbi:hypothetical protein EVAR_65697_1 [Eumeta japonica]|uniref:Uncharacterized protein n=1 Tax=Eumeta variegata TaxID=151549 RepID=A0A4C2ABX2_EUMVA|nr:hypothetical protein EVAR_65697_1 [Eumeta japonica]
MVTCGEMVLAKSAECCRVPHAPVRLHALQKERILKRKHKELTIKRECESRDRALLPPAPAPSLLRVRACRYPTPRPHAVLYDVRVLLHLSACYTIFRKQTRGLPEIRRSLPPMNIRNSIRFTIVFSKITL